MKYKVGDIVPFEQTQEACDWVNAYQNGFYLTDYERDENGNMRLIVCQMPQPTIEELQVQIQKQLTGAVQHVLDAKAQELNYDNCLSVCSYIDTGVAKFDAEGRAFRAWRSAVWAKGYEILAQVQAGQRAIPTEEQLIAELPKLVINY